MNDTELDELLDTWKSPDVPASLRAGLRSRLAAGKARTSIRVPVRWLAAFALAGGALALGASLLWNGALSSKRAAGSPVYTFAGPACAATRRETQMDVQGRTEHRMAVAGRQAGRLCVSVRPAEPQALWLLLERADARNARVPVYRTAPGPFRGSGGWSYRAAGSLTRAAHGRRGQRLRCRPLQFRQPASIRSYRVVRRTIGGR